MPSTNKTSLGLNMWEASDKPVRQDFVNDNVIVNDNIVKLKSDLVSKSSISVHPSAVHTVVADGSALVPCASVISQKGTGLSVDSDGKVVIGAGISQVLIGGQVYFYEGTTGVSKVVEITKNGALAIRYGFMVETNYQYLSTAPRLLNVAKGDTIALNFNGKKGDTVMNYNFATFLTVMEI